MSFASDTSSGVHPKVFEALAAANHGTAPSYGADPLTKKVEAQFNHLFETDTTVFLVPTGTAANALALSTLTPPFGSIFCHKEAHIHCDEGGAPEFYSHGAKLVPLNGANGKIHAGDLDAALANIPNSVHQVQPAALSLTQATEAGTVYGSSEIHHLCDTAKKYGLYTHMDGARFANAVQTLGCSPAEITWHAGVDVLCFGATKNGTLAVEALVYFNKALAREASYRRKRGGHLFSKMRFLSAQMAAYLDGDLWLDNAKHANAMAQRLKDGLLSVKGADLYHPVEANEVFISLPEPLLALLEKGPHDFHRWHDAHSPVIRLVTSFNTAAETVDDFIQQAHAAAAQIAP